MPNGGAVKYTQIAVQSRACSAEATVRAGFRLVPESGASKVMNVATSSPEITPVNRAIRRDPLEKRRTTSIKTKVIENSATNAAPEPNGPGSVTRSWVAPGKVCRSEISPVG